DARELVGQRDGLAVVVEYHRDLEVPGRLLGTDAGGDRERHAEQAVGTVDLTPQEVVPGDRPGLLLEDLHVEVPLLEVAELLGHDHRGTVGEGDEAQIHVAVASASTAGAGAGGRG